MFIANSKPTICEIVGLDTIRIFWKIVRNGDMFKHIDLEFKSDSNLKYNFSAWIEYNRNIIYDFGKVQYDKKIRLDCKDNIINLLNKQKCIIFLIVEIPKTQLANWKENTMSIGYIYGDSGIRRLLTIQDEHKNLIKN